MQRALRKAAGFTLLEVLIAMFLIALALLGSAALQAYSMKVTQGGQFRAQAVVLGMDLIERIEANNTGAVAGSYVGTLSGAGEGGADCVASSCSPADMAAYDLAQVRQNLVRQLPESTATVTRTGAGPYVYTVQVNWKERAYKAKSSKSGAQTTENFSFTVSRTIYDKAAVL